MQHFSNFVVLAAAVILQLFGYFAAAVKFDRLDVLLLYTEYSGITANPAYRKEFVGCLKETFNFGPNNETDCRSAALCIGYIDDTGDKAKWYKKLDYVLHDDAHFTTCFSDRWKNSIDYHLTKLKKIMDDEHSLRDDRSIVTIVFGDDKLNNDLKDADAMFFVNPPNQLYLAIETLPTDTSNLTKNGIDSSHLLKFNGTGNCPEFVTSFQGLMCGTEKVKNEGSCESTGTQGMCEKEITYTYESPLKQAEIICGSRKKKESCTCDTTTQEMASEDTATPMAAVTEDEGLPAGIIAAIVIGVIILLAVIAGCVWFFVFRRSGGSSEQVGAAGGSQAGAGAGGSQMSPSQRAEGGGSQKSVKNPPKSTSSKQPKKSTKSMGGGSKK